MFTRIRGIYDALAATLEAGWLPLVIGLSGVLLLTRVL